MSLEKFLEASIVSPPRGMTLPLVISYSMHPGSAFRYVATHLAIGLRCYAMHLASGAAEMILF